MDGTLIVVPFRGYTAGKQTAQRAGWLAPQTVSRWVSEAPLQRPLRRPTLIRSTRLPEEVARLLAPLKLYFSYRPFLVFCWLVVAHLVCFEKATLPALSRQIPDHVAAWHLRRLLAAGRWQWAQVLEWLVTQALAAFPPPRDGVLYLVGDST